MNHTDNFHRAYGLLKTAGFIESLKEQFQPTPEPEGGGLKHLLTALGVGGAGALAGRYGGKQLGKLTGLHRAMNGMDGFAQAKMLEYGSVLDNFLDPNVTKRLRNTMSGDHIKNLERFGQSTGQLTGGLGGLGIGAAMGKEASTGLLKTAGFLESLKDKVNPEPEPEGLSVLGSALRGAVPGFIGSTWSGINAGKNSQSDSPGKDAFDVGLLGAIGTMTGGGFGKSLLGHLALMKANPNIGLKALSRKVDDMGLYGNVAGQVLGGATGAGIGAIHANHRNSKEANFPDGGTQALYNKEASTDVVNYLYS